MFGRFRTPGMDDIKCIGQANLQHKNPDITLAPSDYMYDSSG